MSKIKNIIALLLTLVIMQGFSISEFVTAEPSSANITSSAKTKDVFDYSAYPLVNPLDVVAKPNFYLNKNIKINGKFDKFSTLGLDYEPAMKSSDDYISFLIQRPDVSDHNLPLSEMKCFLPRSEAEKYIELTSGDKIEFFGTVYSTALGDVWVDVKKFNALNKKTVETK